jgi:hypothetical protein
MDIKKRIGKTSFGILLLMVVTVTLVSQTSALPEYSSEIQKIYANDSCTMCHIDQNGGDNLTGYGIKFARQSNHVEYPADALRTIGEPPVKVPIKMSEYLLALQGVYGNGSCTTCHIKPSGNELAEYGKKFAAQPDHVNDSIVALRVIGVPGEIVNVTTTDEKKEKKSPGFEIVVTIGMISVIYMLRREWSGKDL